MRFLRAIAMVLLLADLAAAQAELPREVLLLARVKQKMKQNLLQVPNYTCLETIERAVARADRDFQTLDTVRVEVAEVGSRELFAWPGGLFEEKDLTSFVSGGLIGNGDFVLHARSIFVNDNAAIRYAGEEEMGGRRLERYDFRVPQFLSGYRIRAGGGQATVPYHGSFWADPRTFDVFRLALETDDIPAEFGIVQTTTRIDYQRVRIGASEALLPQAAELVMTEFNGRRSRNRMEFSRCREYGSESVISFEQPPARLESVPAPPAASFIDLPAGLILRLQLETPIDSGKAMVGDVVRAKVMEEVRREGRVLVPKGALASGRIRRLEEGEHPLQHFVVGLEFSEVEFDHTRARFQASLEEIGPAAGLERTLALESSHTYHRSITETIAAAQFPGVGTFFMRGSRFVLPKGLRMVWETEERGR